MHAFNDETPRIIFSGIMLQGFAYKKPILGRMLVLTSDLCMLKNSAFGVHLKRQLAKFNTESFTRKQNQLRTLHRLCFCYVCYLRNSRFASSTSGNNVFHLILPYPLNPRCKPWAYIRMTYIQKDIMQGRVFFIWGPGHNVDWGPLIQPMQKSIVSRVQRCRCQMWQPETAAYHRFAPMNQELCSTMFSLQCTRELGSGGFPQKNFGITLFVTQENVPLQDRRCANFLLDGNQKTSIYACQLLSREEAK